MSPRLCLWDLGYGTDALFSQEPLAIKQFSDTGFLSGTLLLMCPTSDGEGVVFCVNLATSWESSFDEVHIMEVYPTSNRPRFNTIATYQLTEEEQDDLDCYDMTCDLSGYHANAQIILWDFRNNTKHRIECDEEADTMLIFGNMVLISNSRGYNIFSTPTSASTSNGTSKPQLITSASFLLETSEFSLPLTWYIAAQSRAPCKQPETHAYTIVHEKDLSRVHRYTLSTSTTESGSPSATFLQTYDLPDDENEYNVAMTCFTMAGDEHALLWSEGQSINMRTIRAGESQVATMRQLYERVDGEADSSDEWVWSFCPFAARACTLSFRGEIRIMDFVD